MLYDNKDIADGLNKDNVICCDRAMDIWDNWLSVRRFLGQEYEHLVLERGRRENSRSAHPCGINEGPSCDAEQIGGDLNNEMPAQPEDEPKDAEQGVQVDEEMSKKNEMLVQQGAPRHDCEHFAAEEPENKKSCGC